MPRAGGGRALRAGHQPAVDGARYHQVDRALIGRLARQAGSPTVLAALHSEPGDVHHELSGENVLVPPDGYRMSDRQRPHRGPVPPDLARLLASLGVDPRRHVAGGGQAAAPAAHRLANTSLRCKMAL